MSTKERILMIRLAEKLERQPAYAKALGLESAGAGNHQNTKPASKGLTNP